MQIEPLYFRLFAGLGVKTMGYFLIAAGIFLSIGNAYLAIRVVYLGVFLVAVGWVIVIRTLRMSRELKAETRATLAAYLESGLVKEGDTVTIRGSVGDKGVVRVFLNGFKVSEVESSGEFCVRFPAPKEGKYEVEVRFVGDAYVEPKKLRLQVVRKQEMEKIRRIKKLAYGVVIAIFVMIFVVLVLIIV